MIRKFSLAAVAVLLLGGLQVRGVAAQTSTVNGIYLAGWNMVGAPAGADFGNAVALDAYGPSGYISTDHSHPLPCQGYWADFVNPTAVPLPISVGPEQDCALQVGWNLIGNPFSGKALLPAGVDGYYWNPDTAAYDIVQAIPPGGAVWVYSSTTASLPLQYAAAVTGSPTTLEIDFLSTGPVTVHVGDSIKLVLPAATPYLAQTDGSYLHLESAGTQGSLTCVGSGCQLQTNSRFWLWHAVRAGITSIAISPGCAAAVPPCLAPSVEIAVTILP